MPPCCWKFASDEVLLATTRLTTRMRSQANVDTLTLRQRQTAIDVAYGVLKEQEDVILR